MTQVSTAIRIAASRLETTSDTPRLDAELLMAHALGIDRSTLLLGAMHDPVPDGFDALVTRRAAHEPLAYITGHQAFWDLDLKVTPDVLIPRADSETLIETAIALRDDMPPHRIADLGTGSGALLLAAISIWPDANGLGIDSSLAALAVAQHNGQANGLGDRVQFAAIDWTKPGWSDALQGPFDLILANPPYVETGANLAPNVRDYEPHAALFAGNDGLDDYRILIPQMPMLLAAGGIAIFEIGASQAVAVSALARAAGLSVDICQDLAGNDRAAILSV